MKRLLCVLPIGLLLLTVACTTAAIAVASLGIAGAALESYCVAGAAGCSPAVTDYAALIVSQAGADASILESGQTTTTQIAEIVDNLNSAIAQGSALSGLTAQQQAEVDAILTAASSTLNLVEALTPPATGVASANAARSSIKIVLTKKDKAELAKMKLAIAGARAKR